MKKTQRDPVHKIDEFEDLTIFANESFDTQDVDLFEFSSEESSLLTRLKSIILSLDWEINDEILQELADEIENLESQWQGDKVAEVYLQGLHKIGGYIRSKGAYAHPNSIKLLLTFFYDFEKIISSHDITGEEITQLLASDVRKFRILQYQINQNEEEPVSGLDKKTTKTAESAIQAFSSTETDHIKQLKAAILSLDWEVTDENLKQFNTKLSQCREMFDENKPALVLIQGLQVLGDYIAEKRAETHPEAFTLLHSFNETLEQFSKGDEQSLDKDTIENLLVDQINGINNLKMLVAALPTSPLDSQTIDTFVEGISAPVAGTNGSAFSTQSPPEEVQLAPTLFLEEDFTKEMGTNGQADALLADTLEAEIDTLFAMDMIPAMETADTQYPDEILSPDAIHPLDDELADDFIEANLSASRGLRPALSDTDEVSGYDEEAEPIDLSAQIDLAEQLDFLFPKSDTSTTTPPETISAVDSSSLVIAVEDEEEPVAALADVYPDELDKQIEKPFDDTEESDDVARIRREESETAQSALDIQSKLDDFFADALEEPEPTGSESAKAISVEEIEQSLFFSEESAIESALADSEEERGFSEEEAVASLEYTPMGEIEEKLDFFFGTDTDDELVAVAEENTKAAEETFSEEEAAVTNADILDNELEGTLDFFFEANEDDEEEETAQTEEDELTQALEATIDDRELIASDLFPEGLPAAALMPEENRAIQLATLGALLPGVVRTTSREKAVETTQLIAALKDAGLSSEQQALIQLLDSVISLLTRLPSKDGAATEKLVNYLFEHLLDKQCRPEVVLEAVKRFTNWLQEASNILPSLLVKTDQEIGPRFEYTAKELYAELSELRGHIKEEFAKLRHEMHHKN